VVDHGWVYSNRLHTCVEITGYEDYYVTAIVVIFQAEIVVLLLMFLSVVLDVYFVVVSGTGG